MGKSLQSTGAGAWHWRLPDSPFPIWVFDPADGAIVAANDATVAAYGYSHDELLARHAQDLCQPIGPTERLTAALRAVSPWVGTFEQQRKDGATFVVDISMVETGDFAHRAIMVIAYPPASRGSRPERRT